MPKALFGSFVSLGAGWLSVSVDSIIISPFYFGGWEHVSVKFSLGCSQQKAISTQEVQSQTESNYLTQ